MSNRIRGFRVSIKHLLLITMLVSLVFALIVTEQRNRRRQCATAKKLIDAGWTVMFRQPPLLGPYPALVSNLDTKAQETVPVTRSDLNHIATFRDLHTVVLESWDSNGLTCGICDEDLQLLQPLGLDLLIVSSPHITRAGLDHIATMSSLTQLEIGGVNITADDIEWLGNSLPGVQVKWLK
jgi:hypothetical protein